MQKSTRTVLAGARNQRTATSSSSASPSSLQVGRACSVGVSMAAGATARRCHPSLSIGRRGTAGRTALARAPAAEEEEEELPRPTPLTLPLPPLLLLLLLPNARAAKLRALPAPRAACPPPPPPPPAATRVSVVRPSQGCTSQ
jgi:hypothetical protein